MKRRTLLILVILFVSSLFVVRAFAQASMNSWRLYADLNSGPMAPGTYDFLVPLQVMDQAQDELADLRLFDPNGKEIPFALRVRREVFSVEDFPRSLFNYAESGRTASEVSVDLGQNQVEHNEVLIQTSGRNFRRRVVVEGTDNAGDWKTLVSDGIIFGFQSSNQVAESLRVSYPTSRFRYLRVRLFADETTDKTAPPISDVSVSRVARAPGELASWTVPVPSVDSLKNQGAPSSAWKLDLEGRVPIDRLSLDIDMDSFSRPFQLEVIDDPQNRRLVASGELVRRVNEPREPLVIKLDQEEHARKLRLVVTDYSNATLPITAIMASAPARQVVFDLKEQTSGPLRLFFGNYNADSPHYDFEMEVATRLPASPARASVGSFLRNPGYRPPPLPFTERQPWLIYLVLAVSSMALALILLNLARATLGRVEAGKPAGNERS